MLVNYLFYCYWCVLFCSVLLLFIWIFSWYFVICIYINVSPSVMSGNTGICEKLHKKVAELFTPEWFLYHILLVLWILFVLCLCTYRQSIPVPCGRCQQWIRDRLRSRFEPWCGWSSLWIHNCHQGCWRR